MIWYFIFIIIISAIITERLLEGLHRFYWFRKLKIYLVGEDDGLGIVQIPWLREYIRCKFCQSWGAGWITAWGMSHTFLFKNLTDGMSLCDRVGLIIIIGLIAGSLANKLHDIGNSIKAAKYKGLQ